MNLMDMVNGLNRMDDVQPFSPGAFMLAAKIIDLLNRLYWPDTVAIDTNRMSVMAKCSSRNATLNARNELIDRGVLVIVSKGKKGSPSTYRLANLTKYCSQDKPNQGGDQDRIGTENGTESGMESGPNCEPNQVHINRQDKDKTKTRQNNEVEKRARFTPPTPDDVRAYCSEKGFQVDAVRFCDFYASKGWRVGSSPMKDWRAAVRTWATREQSPTASTFARGPKTVGEQQYTQREYTNNLDAFDRMMQKYMESCGEESGNT